MLALALIIGLMAPAESLTPSFTEAKRLVQELERRRAVPGGAVDLIRLARLAPWCPHGWVRQQLRMALQIEGISPLNRGMALWLLRADALETHVQGG